MYVCVIFSPVITHKLIVTSFCQCPSHPFVQQVYFPAFALLMFTICTDLLEVTKWDSGPCPEFLSAVMLLASKVHFKLVNSSGHA